MTTIRRHLLMLALVAAVLEIGPPRMAPSIGSAFAQCNGPGSTVTLGVSFANNTAGGLSLAASFALPAGLLALPGTCTTDVGTCSVVSAASVTASATLAPFQSTLVTARAQVADGAAFGATLATVVTASFNGGPPQMINQNVDVNCPPASPGLVHTVNSPTGDQRTGSILVFPVYTSSTGAPSAQFSRIALTNTEATRSVATRLFFVDGATGGVTQTVQCLGAEETAEIDAATVAPNATGFVVAIAVDAATGCPIGFNHLTGSETVGFATGHAATLPAQAVAQIAGALPNCTAASTSVVVPFNGVSYSFLPRALATGGVPSRGDGNNTLLIVNRIGGNFTTTASATGPLFGTVFDDTGSGHSFSVSSSTPQLRGVLSNAFPRVVPRFEKLIPSGRTGSLRLWSLSDIGLTGALLNANASSAVDPGAFNEGHNLHHLTLSASPSITIPVAATGCP